MQATWRRLICERGMDTSEPLPPLPSRLVTDDDLKEFYEAMKIYEETKDGVSNVGVKRKAEYLGGLDTQHYGRGKRAREVCYTFDPYGLNMCVMYYLRCPFSLSPATSFPLNYDVSLCSFLFLFFNFALP